MSIINLDLKSFLENRRRTMEANNQLSFIVCWDFSQSPNHRFRVVADQLLQSTCIKRKFLVLKSTLGEKIGLFSPT